MANPGGWVDFHGNLPTVVVDAVRDTLTTQENLEVEHMNFTNIQSQVVAGKNYRFNVTVTCTDGNVSGAAFCFLQMQVSDCFDATYQNISNIQIFEYHFQVWERLDGTAEVTSHERIAQ